MSVQGNRKYQDYLTVRRQWLEAAVSSVHPGLIAELGCGSGFAVETLSALFPDNRLIGVDYDLDRLIALKTKNLPHVSIICGDLRQPPLADDIFNTVFSLSTLHIIYSRHGREGVMMALRSTKALLKKSGRLIIQDFLKPAAQEVELTLTSRGAIDAFLRYAVEFTPRRVEFARKGETIRLDLADAVDFLSRYKYAGTEEWADEMIETHLYFTADDFAGAVSETGMKLIDIRRLPRGKQTLSYDDIEYDFDPTIDWIQVVAKN